jgi:predicted PurR-regulated permease PerM
MESGGDHTDREDGAAEGGARASEGSGRPVGATGDDAAFSGEDRRRGQLQVLLVLAAAATYLIVRILWPFLPALVTAGVLAALFFPLQRSVADRLGRATPAAFVSTAVVVFLVLVPLAILTGILVEQLVAGSEFLAHRAGELLGSEGALRAWVERAAGYVGMDPGEVTVTGQEELQRAVSFLAQRTLRFLSGLGGWLLQAAVGLFTLFYLLRDGKQLQESIAWVVPLEPSRTSALLDRTREVIFATVYGILVVAVAQGVLGGAAFWLVGIPAAAFWGTLMGLLSLLPAVGPPFIWLPAGVILLAQGRVVDGLVLLAVGALVISTVDNVLRALLVSDRAHLHPLVVFFSVLGGLVLFGAAGVFVGPVLFVLGLSVISMARMTLLPGDVPEHLPWGLLRRGDDGGPG